MRKRGYKLLLQVYMVTRGPIDLSRGRTRGRAINRLVAISDALVGVIDMELSILYCGLGH